MATAPAIRQKNQLYKDRSVKGIVASKAADKTKVVNKKAQYSYWAIGVLAFALFGGVVLQLIGLFF